MVPLKAESGSRCHKGIAVAAVYFTANRGSPDVAIMLMSEYGTLGKGDYIWHFRGDSPLETRQRLPAWGLSLDVTPGCVDVILLADGCKDAVTCSAAALRNTLNKYSEKGNYALPQDICGMQSATWETRRQSQRNTSLKSVQSTIKSNDDAKLIAWLSDQMKKQGQRPMAAVSEEIREMVPMIAKMMRTPISFNYDIEADLHAADRKYLNEALEAKAAAIGVGAISVRTWRCEGCIDFNEVEFNEADVVAIESTKKKRKKLNEAEFQHSKHAEIAQNAQAPSCDLQSLQQKYAQLEKAHDAAMGIICAKNIMLEDARAQEHYASTQALKYKSEVDRLCGYLSTDAPPIEQSILAYFAGEKPGAFADIELYRRVPEYKRVNALLALQCCMENDKSEAFVMGVIKDSLGMEPYSHSNKPTKEKLQDALSSVLFEETCVQKLVDAWEQRDAHTLGEVIASSGCIPPSVAEKVLHDFLVSLF